jgi:hypothetical protein
MVFGSYRLLIVTVPLHVASVPHCPRLRPNLSIGGDVPALIGMPGRFWYTALTSNKFFGTGYAAEDGPRSSWD